MSGSAFVVIIALALAGFFLLPLHSPHRVPPGVLPPISELAPPEESDVE